MPFTNAKLGIIFSRMLIGKSNWCNQLARDHFDSLCLNDEEGENLKMFHPKPSIHLWFSEKVQKLAWVQKLIDETSKMQLQCKCSEFVDIIELAVLDLKGESCAIFEFFSQFNCNSQEGTFKECCFQF